MGSIIGKRGEQIKKIREESGAKINISDGSCPERIVTITGTLNVINKAFAMVCNKFEEVCALLLLRSSFHVLIIGIVHFGISKL